MTDTAPLEKVVSVVDLAVSINDDGHSQSQYSETGESRSSTDRSPDAGEHVAQETPQSEPDLTKCGVLNLKIEEGNAISRRLNSTFLYSMIELQSLCIQEYEMRLSKQMEMVAAAAKRSIVDDPLHDNYFAEQVSPLVTEYLAAKANMKTLQTVYTSFLPVGPLIRFYQLSHRHKILKVSLGRRLIIIAEDFFNKNIDLKHLAGAISKVLHRRELSEGEIRAIRKYNPLPWLYAMCEDAFCMAIFVFAPSIILNRIVGLKVVAGFVAALILMLNVPIGSSAVGRGPIPQKERIAILFAYTAVMVVYIGSNSTSASSSNSG